MIYTKNNILKGAVIYATGDTIAALILGEFNTMRLLGMVFIGASFYAFEIPNYFKWIETKTQNLKGTTYLLSKTGLAIAYFNPLWIARHLFFIKLFSGQFDVLNGHLFYIALLSFLVNIPISFVANFIIQTKTPLKWRFLASALFSALMAIYYALSETLFSL
ncbi:MAG: hypothetical protein L3J45_04305 [Flavobacteriaceae bacterium]|nr:hypothetical protein [Flavobacteriaceae bacterium]